MLETKDVLQAAKQRVMIVGMIVHRSRLYERRDDEGARPSASGAAPPGPEPVPALAGKPAAGKILELLN
jgi:hypothetical protein